MSLLRFVANQEATLNPGRKHPTNGPYFASPLSFFFTIVVTVYVIFLPKLAVQAGIPKQAVIYILMLDQLIFVAMDLAMGAIADRVSRVLGRLGHVVLAVTLGSCGRALPVATGPARRPVAALRAAHVPWTASFTTFAGPPDAAREGMRLRPVCRGSRRCLLWVLAWRVQSDRI